MTGIPSCEKLRFGRFWLPAWDAHAEAHFIKTPRGCQLDHLDAAMQYVRAWGTAIDGGAHVGSWSIPLAKMFKRVLAFEPHPDTYDCLMVNCREHLSGPDITHSIDMLQVALGDRPRVGKLVPRHPLSSLSMCFHDHAEEGPDAEVVSLDAILAARPEPPVGFLKLDVEGMELLALMGAEATLARDRPALLVEMKEKNLARYAATSADVRAWLEARSYSLKQTIEQDEIWTPND